MKSTAPRILVVDDEQAVLDLLVYNLRKAHYDVLTATNGRQALELALQAEPDLVLLDLMLPEVDGLDVCREIRRTSRMPIIMITARGEEVDRVVGLELGADDYLCKPFSVRELMARIKAVLRRTQPESDAILVGASLAGASSPNAQVLTGPAGLRLDMERREATLGEAPIELTRLEFDLLQMLLLNTGRVLTRERLLEEVWGYDFAGDTRAVDSAVKRLRARLRAVNPQADFIEAVRGLGYKFKGIRS
jgi:two-component system alkaline phosphatase synthesis response regulator PhoP